jgi:hypothetical protein
MPLPELLVPVVTVGGPVAIAVTVFRLGPAAVLRLLAGTVAIITKDKERGERSLEVLRILGRDGSWWRGRSAGGTVHGDAHGVHSRSQRQDHPGHIGGTSRRDMP